MKSKAFHNQLHQAFVQGRDGATVPARYSH